MSNRKIRLLGLLAVVAIVATACGASGTTSNGPKSLLAEIKARGSLKIGVAEAQPWVVKDATTGEWGGVYVDVLRDWAENTLDVKLEPVATSWENMVSGLQAGQYDVGVAINHRPARALVVTFTNPLISDIGAFAVIPSTSSIDSWEKLNDAKNTVCVMQGAAEDLTLTKSNPNFQIQRLGDQNSCRLALQSGRVQAFFDDWSGHGPFAKSDPNIKTLFPPTPFVNEGIAYAIPHGYSYDDVAALNIQLGAFSGKGLLSASQKKWGATNPVQFSVGDVPAYVRALEAVQYPSN